MGDGCYHILFARRYFFFLQLFIRGDNLLCLGVVGYTPFDRDTQQQEMEAIIAGDYKFEPSAWDFLFG
jgi:hypothetical protein